MNYKYINTKLEMRKTIFLSAMCIFMMLSTQKANAQSDYDFSATNNGQTIYYNITSPTSPLTVEVTVGDDEYTGDIVIPGSVANGGNTYSVTVIGEGAFFECSGLTSVTIPNPVITIGEGAFYYCSGLTSITIPNSVTTIEEAAFSFCTGLTSVTIGNSVTTIGEGAFYYCIELTSIAIPNSVTTIRDYAFTLCNKLTGIDVEPDNSNFSSGDGVLFNKNKTILICCPAGKTGSYTIPNSVTTIKEVAFALCQGLTSITIPNSVTTIEEWAFNECRDLASIVIPNSVTTIGKYAFAYCDGLTSVTLPNTIISIEDGVFADCDRLTSVTIPNSVTTIGEHAFADCDGLTSITIPNSVTTIGKNAFTYCYGLTEIHVKAINPPQIFANTFNQVSKSIPIYVCGSVEAYRNAPYWSEFTDIRQDTNCNVGIADIYGENETTIYPNPATDNISISLPENISQAVFTLYDMQGKVLIKQEVSNQETIQVNSFASGIYIYNVRTDKQNHTGKLIRK
jgi:hypothetical protein